MLARLIKLILLLLLIKSFTSCVREDELLIDKSQFEKKLVVYSVLSPQADSIFVTLSETSGHIDKSIYSTGKSLNGKVMISDSVKQYDLKHISLNPSVYGCSQSEFKIEKGREYFLTIDVEGFQKARAKTIVPGNFCKWNFTRFPVYGIYIIDNGFSSDDFFSFYFEAEWTPSNNGFEKNYFAVRKGGVRYLLEETPNASFGYRGFHYKVVDSLYFQGDIIETEGSVTVNDSGNYRYSTIVSEDFADEYSVSSGFEWTSISQNTPTGEVFNNLTFYLLTLDKNFSDYKELCEQYEESSDYLSLFFSSFNGILPSLSNIEGGYGLFGSYGIDSVSYQFKNKVNFEETVKGYYNGY